MGPLTGLRVLEIASLAPAPFGCMMLADLGADVARIDRLSTTDSSEAMTPAVDPLGRGRRSVPLDLKADEGRTAVLRLVEGADVFVEGFRPGVAERLGVGPGVCLDINPRLVYARMTGWGQSGPMALRAGHDINYIAASGALDPIGRPGEPPTVPLNLVGDFGGGGMLLTAGVLAALYERNQSGLGQVIDVAMVDGSALLTASLHGMIASGNWSPERGANLLDGGAPFYDTYETADGRHVSVGAIERKFYAQLINGLGLVPSELPDQFDRSGWPELRQRIARAFKEHDRDHWGAVFAEIDACVFPVLSPSEAAHHAHATERGSFVTVDDVTQPAPAPRFSRTPTAVPQPSAAALMVGDALRSWGLAADEDGAA
jgi:crotonobetainyl-CoA:carnitine CoA-transferase CaiB-like acyl-CoA transferase